MFLLYDNSLFFLSAADPVPDVFFITKEDKLEDV